jgi:hypothetical protein
MATNSRRVGSIGFASALLLVAVSCSLETSSGEEDIVSTTGAISCDPSPIVGVCQQQCVDSGCRDGSAIASCMNACIGVYCAQSTFVPNERCGSSAYWPPPVSAVQPSANGCESDLWWSCDRRCDFCAASPGRDACKRTCHVKWCPGGPIGDCRDQNREACMSGLDVTSDEPGCFFEPDDEHRRACMARCLDLKCPG